MVKFPVMNGYTATKKIKVFKSYLPIIAQTVYAMKSDKNNALKAGCDGYISKLIVEDILFELIKKHLNY
ncbi:MAG: response regulator [Bacteroidales bacterium]|nr:response regulator [Bacteroidales bacterium]